MKVTVLSVAAMAVAAPMSLLAQSQEIATRFDTRNDREFDFWVGEWSVLLRTKQDDNSWEDSRDATAKIYRILDGKAILELWDEDIAGAGIRGFSLRYFDHTAQEWILHLNWPGPNRSGMGRLSGMFRHGRGEFFSTRTDAQGELLSRYTFSDVTPTSLRWDDAFSRDGGKTWTNNWIMEFTRTAPSASWPSAGEVAHTYYTGDRCDLPAFREFERLEGRWTGEAELTEGSTARTVPASMIGYKVLDGCAVLTFLSWGAGDDRHQEFGFKTYNTFARLLEDSRLDDRTGTGLRSYYGSREDEVILLQAPRSANDDRTYVWRMSDARTVRMTVERDGTTVLRLLLERMDQE